jgi:hypothetical protein
MRRRPTRCPAADIDLVEEGVGPAPTRSSSSRRRRVTRWQRFSGHQHDAKVVRVEERIEARLDGGTDVFVTVDLVELRDQLENVVAVARGGAANHVPASAPVRDSSKT